jgi:ankyrin repeat protein
MYASSLNYIAIMSMFSKQTGKKDYLNNYTALMINIIYSNGDDEIVVDILKEEIGQQDKIGNTALMYAIRYNKINIAKA